MVVYNHYEGYIENASTDDVWELLGPGFADIGKWSSKHGDHNCRPIHDIHEIPSQLRKDAMVSSNENDNNNNNNNNDDKPPVVGRMIQSPLFGELPEILTEFSNEQQRYTFQVGKQFGGVIRSGKHTCRILEEQEENEMPPSAATEGGSKPSSSTTSESSTSSSSSSDSSRKTKRTRTKVVIDVEMNTAPWLSCFVDPILQKRFQTSPIGPAGMIPDLQKYFASSS